MKKKLLGLSALVLIYALAVAIGYTLFSVLVPYMHFVIAILIADVSATVFVWASGLIFKTASVYDPYWSVQTFFIYLGLLIYFDNWNLFSIVPLVVIFIYSVRLTVNFIIGFHDLSYIDWRYKMLCEKSGKLYQLVNLFGICMFPTLVVYSCSIPLMIYASLSVDAYSYLDFIGAGVILIGTLLELISDIQMKSFIKHRTSRSDIINVGLWNYSRHPNYLGEIMIWFGAALILIIHNYQYFYFGFGAIINLAMFLFISIPMEENHMKEYKPNMDEYISRVSMLLILPNKSQKKNAQ